MVGTGSSATQVVPAIQPIVQQLYVFQREPGLGHAEGRARLHRRRAAPRSREPWRRRRERWRQKYLLEKSLWRGHLYRPGTKTNEARRQFCLDYIDRQFADRPDLRDGRHADVPVSRQAAGLRQHLLSRAQEGRTSSSSRRRWRR